MVHPPIPQAEDERELQRQRDRQLLQEVLHEVRIMSIRQAEAGTGSTEQEGIRQHFQEKESQRVRELKEELNTQLAKKEQKCHETERKLSETREELRRKTSELVRIQEEHGSAIACKERLEAEQRRRDLAGEQCAERLSQRCEDMERREQELQERVRALNSMRSSLEDQKVQADDRERERELKLQAATDAARRIEGDKRLLESELDNAREEVQRVREQLRDAEQETRDLRSRTAQLEDQLRDALEKHRAEQDTLCAEQERLRPGQDLGPWYHKFVEEQRKNQESDKENEAYQKTYYEQRKDIWLLENQLRQERHIANICTPGDFLRLAKAHEEANLAVENGSLKRALAKSQCDLEVCRRRLSEYEKELQRSGRVGGVLQRREA